jgi:adenosylcobinamide-GDP ribazoletransferase
MRRSDIGPFGVAALLFSCVLQITALATVNPGWPAAAGLAGAVVTGRMAVVLATGPSTPAARPDGFGSLVAGGTTARARIAATGTLLIAVGVIAAAVWGWYPALRGVVAVLAGLLAGDLLRRLARRRLGGMTGDIFGAQIELATATVLVTAALTM